MSNFPEPSTPGFVPVYQLKRTDAVDAGAAGDGPSNLPLKNLVERTAYLKKEVENLDTAFGGVVIGSTVQAYDDDLQAIAALTTTGLIDRTGAGTAATRETGATGLAVLASADAATARTAIGAMANTAPEIIINANGTAYRWPNGLQICRLQWTVDQAASTAIGNLFRTATASVWTFPAAFDSYPVCFGSVASAAFGRWLVFMIPSNTSVQYIQLCATSITSGAAGNIAAIGTYTP